jgi:sterol desaturase/sphingolipid hydroxylase (fatty acid hydroxylase superfamily)
MNIILWAIPLFIVLILIEFIVDTLRGTAYYRLNDSVSSLNAGILSRVTQVFWRLVPFVIYVQVYEAYALTEMPVNWLTWILAFVAYDFFYYWHHRFGHERNFFWAAHVVHHSSEEYNLTTALRQTSGSLIGWIFYLPMAIAGFSPLQLITVAALNLIYQFWVHSRHIPKLGWFENWFITPSNHRVHHAINDIYVDRNYGGVFIIWDRLFGTYQEELETEPCVYGIRKPIKSWNPLWVNVHYYSQLFRDAWHTRRWSDKFRVWFARTGWRPADVAERYPQAEFDMASYRKFDIPVGITVQLYIFSHLVLIIFGLGAYMAMSSSFTTLDTVILGSAIVVSCTSLGLLLEQRHLAVAIEQLRLLGISAVILVSDINLAMQVLICIVLAISLYFSQNLVPQRRLARLSS